MKTMKLLFSMLLFTGLLANPLMAQEVQEAQKGDGIHFGEKISEEGAISFSEFHKNMADKSEMETKIKGEVTGVCQKKGCWMTMNEDGKELFIKFKDYAFFVPKDISGREAIIEGVAYREVVSVDELRHMAEDAGKSEEEIAKITEPKEELRFMADGVILLQEKD